MKRLWLPTAVLTLVLLASLGCRAPQGTGDLVYGLTLAPSSMDPHVGASSELGIPLTSVYDPLVWLAPDGSFVPGLANSWTLSKDGTTYRFELRSDVTFHDGTAFNAAAVCVNLNRIVDPATRSAKARGLLGPYTGCRAVDEHTVEVTFSSPHAPFLAAASQVYLAIASPAALKEWGEDYQFHQVGTGPFRFVEYIPKDHLTLERYAEYDWAPSFLAHQGPAYLQTVEFRFYVDPATRVPALESGQVDVMGEIPPADVAALQVHAEFDVVEVPLPGQPLQVYLNVTRAPLDDLRVRQALLYATNREAIADAVFLGTSPAAHGPLTRATWSYDPSVESAYPYQPAKAESLLAEAGWTDGDGDGVRERHGERLELRTILMGWGFMPEVGQVLQAQLADVGVQLEIEVLSYPAAVQAAAAGEHHLIPFTLSSSDPHILRSSFHSSNVGGGFNWSRIDDPELDALLNQGVLLGANSAERERIYAEVQRRIMDQALIIPVRDYVNLNGVSTRVTGLRYDAQGWFPWLYDVQVE